MICRLCLTLIFYTTSSLYNTESKGLITDMNVIHKSLPPSSLTILPGHTTAAKGLDLESLNDTHTKSVMFIPSRGDKFYTEQWRWEIPSIK